MRTVIIFCLCLSAFAAQAQNDVNYTYMDSLFQQLPEVLVKGERPVVKAERGKLVYDLPRMVERLPVNNAYEAVKELPGIVEQDGNLTLGGRSITLVVNGKSSGSLYGSMRITFAVIPTFRKIGIALRAAFVPASSLS